MRIIKLGTKCRDIATGLPGTVTLLHINMDLHLNYLFQPEGTNPETGLPSDKIPLGIARLDLPDDCYVEIDLPTEVLGSQATDSASGFSGMAVDIVLYINGCIHLVLQPPGVLPKTNAPIKKTEFSILQCTGEKIPVLTPAEKDKEKQERPSPTGDEFQEFIPREAGGLPQS